MAGHQLPDDYYDRIKPQLHERIGREVRLGRSVVDVGCGSCTLVRYLAATYRQQVTGVDISSLSFPQDRHTHNGVRFRCVDRDAADLRFMEEGSADAVVTMWAFHEMAQPERVMRESLRVLRPGGELVIVDFPRDSLAQRLWNENYYALRQIASIVESVGFAELSVRLIDQDQIVWITAHRKADRVEVA